VGKSTVAVNLASALAKAGRKVGLLDIDIHGPSIPKMLGLVGARVSGGERGMQPVQAQDGLKVMSIGLLLEGRDDAVIWRGPRKYSVISQFLGDVDWGDLDFLIVDSPPGTGDEPLSVVQLIGDPDGAVIVTTPQAVAVQDVRRSITFCRKLGLHVVGIIENMSGYTCPECGRRVQILGSGGGQAISREMGVDLLGRIPIEAEVVESGDSGKPIVTSRPESETARAFAGVADRLMEMEVRPETASPPAEKKDHMKIAVPVAQGSLAMHFGHCERFALFEVDTREGRILDQSLLDPPRHEPGVLPRWLHENGADLVITGGMGSRAQNLFAQNGIEVIVGAPAADPEQVVKDYLAGSLRAGSNVCDH
jgi:Mrp family chromosome partitioning ATPase/predicted Fe-Mo cluster-binding NifX family protein